MQTIFKYISQHGAWAFLFMAAISTSLLGPLNQFSFLYTAALLVLPLNISALRKITNINFLIIFLGLTYLINHPTDHLFLFRKFGK